MPRQLARFAWFTLVYNVGVILWGAFVRATGSGAGCGAHWPLCDGQVLPRDPSTEMLVEFVHRASSGLALVAVIVLFVWVRRVTSPADPARRAAGASVVFILIEALLGAGLVLFRLVAENESLARALVMPLHLANTLVLLLCLTLTAHWLSGGAPVNVTHRPKVLAAAVVMLVLLVGVGKTGAVAALGDTLYPATSFSEGLKAEFSPTASLLLRLRVMHPALALVTAVVLVFGVLSLPIPVGDQRGQLARRSVVGLTIIQTGVGFVNVLLLAPVWMQIVHLLLADLLWIALVLASASALSTDVDPARIEAGRPTATA